MVQSPLPAAALQVSAGDNAHAFIGSPSFSKKKISYWPNSPVFYL